MSLLEQIAIGLLVGATVAVILTYLALILLPVAGAVLVFTGRNIFTPIGPGAP